MKAEFGTDSEFIQYLNPENGSHNGYTTTATYSSAREQPRVEKVDRRFKKRKEDQDEEEFIPLLGIKPGKSILYRKFSDGYYQAPIVIKVIMVTILYVFDPVTLTHLVCYSYTPSTWDHSENEDKHLISQVASMHPLELNNSDLDISKNHISNVSNNIVNSNQNRVSSLSISYIEYFYHVFPLHLNSFNSLFSGVISPKLSILISYVDQFTCLTCDIKTFSESLKGVSSYLNYNPAQSLLKSIETFNAKTYVDGVRENIKLMITHLDGKLKYQEIIDHINSIVKSYNDQLKSKYEDFKSKIGKHKTSLGEEIKKYIGKIKGDLTKLSSCAQELSSKISNNIRNLQLNHGKIGQFNKYTSKENLAQTCTYLGGSQSTHFQQIIYTHKKYKELLSESCSEIKSNLEKLEANLKQIKECSGTLTSKLESYKTDISSTKNIEFVLNSLQPFKEKVTKLDEHIEYVKKLEQIGQHITIMKNSLKQVKGKVKEDAEKYINELADITIKKDQVEEEIKNINGMNDCIIKKLELANSAIEFNQSLGTELENLNGVTLESYDFLSYLTIEGKLADIKNKLEKFQEKIKEAIKKPEEQITQLKNQCPKTQGQPKSEEDELIPLELKKLLENDYTSEIPNIKNFIENFLAKIKVIKDVLILLENRKKHSETLINGSKSEVSGITNLKDSITTKLPEAVKILKEFADVQKDTKSFIEMYKHYPKLRELSQYSHKLQDSISYSTKLINFINNSIDYLMTIDYVESLTKSIKCCYESTFQIIKQILDKFKTYVDVITCKLENIKADLCLLKSTIFVCCTGYSNTSVSGNYDLDKLKDYMNNLKFYLENIKSDFTTIKVFFEKIKQESSYIDQYKCPLENLEKVIEEYIKWFERWTSNQLIGNYLKSIKYRIKEIHTIKYLITEHSNMNNIHKIECKLNRVEQSINELECSIEGIARNMIRCSLKSLSNNQTNSCITRGGVINENDPLIINYSILNVTNYKFVIDRSLEFWKFSDEATKLVKFIRFCPCGIYFESRNRDMRPSTFPYPLYSIRTKDINPFSELSRTTMADNVGNHLCLCLVMKYHLRPAILKCILYLRNQDLGALSTISMKHDQYNPIVRLNSDLCKLYCLVLSIIYRIVYWIQHKHNFVWIGYLHPSKTKCFCTIKNTVEYHYLISLILYLSSLIENIWAMDNNSILTAIQSFSSLLSEFDMIKPNLNSLQPSQSSSPCESSCVILNESIKYLFCPVNSCKVSSKLQVILDLLALSKDIPVLDSVIKNYKSKISLTNIDSFFSELHNLTTRAQNIKTYISWVLKKYNSIDGSYNICGQFRNQCCVLSSNLMLFLCVLISLIIKAKLYSKKCTQIKERLCLFLKCICNCDNDNCCIKQIMDSTEICTNNNQNNCEQVLKKCVDSCCDTSCCNGKCPCKQLKDSCDKLKKMCCENSGNNGLCKILENMSTCLKKEDGGKCTCGCCKIVIEGILIIQEMFKLNVSNISKNIMISCKYLLEIMDKIKGTKNSELVIKLIIENNCRYNRTCIKITKNNYSTHFNTYTDHKNIANSSPGLKMGYVYGFYHRQQH